MAVAPLVFVPECPPLKAHVRDISEKRQSLCTLVYIHKYDWILYLTL